jgi:hypothetical protein
MKWRTATGQELAVVNEQLRAEQVVVSADSSFTRYARRKGERDSLVKFEKGVLFQIAQIALAEKFDKVLVYELTLYQPTESLFMRIGDAASNLDQLFGADIEELLDSVFLDAIRRHNRAQNREQEEKDQDFGSF